MTFTELQRAYLGIVRAVRRVYRRADSAGEELERELDRLIKRKRLLQPDDLATAIKKYEAYYMAVGQISRAFQDASTAIQAPVRP